MKRLIFTGILLIVALLSLIVCEAHTPTQKCSTWPRLTYQWNTVGSSHWVKIHWKTGHTSFDTTVNFTGSPYITSFTGHENENVTFTFQDGYNINFQMRKPTCSALPITLTSFTAKDLGYGEIQFKWDLDMEHNVDKYEVWESIDSGIERKVVTVSSLGDTDLGRTYTVQWDYTTTQTAGLGLGIGLIFLSFFIRIKRKWFNYWKDAVNLCIIILGISIASCNKTNVKPTYEKGVKYFRLKEVDKDGNIYTFSTIQLKLN